MFGIDLPTDLYSVTGVLNASSSDGSVAVLTEPGLEPWLPGWRCSSVVVRLFLSGPGRASGHRADRLFAPAALSLRLPAPERLSMQSVNLHHTLSWKPGPGTPAGASYLVYDVRR